MRQNVFFEAVFLIFEGLNIIFLENKIDCPISRQNSLVDEKNRIGIGLVFLEIFPGEVLKRGGQPHT